MLSKQKAKAGHSGSFGNMWSPVILPTSITEECGVKGGTIEISKDDPPTVISRPNRSVEYNEINYLISEFRKSTYTHLQIQENVKSFNDSIFDETLLENSKYSDSYKSRIEFLREEALQEGFMLREASEIDFRRFVFSYPNFRKGSLVLTDSGNIRAIWKGCKGSLIGLQFLGDGMAQYVMFHQRENKKEVSRVSGRDSIQGIVRQIDACDLAVLFVEWRKITYL